MRSSGQEVTHQDPCSRGQGRSKHPEEKHETGVLAQGKEGKNEANATAIYFFFWGGGWRGDRTGLALPPSTAEPEVHPGPSAPCRVSLNFASPPWVVKIHYAPSAWRRDTEEPRTSEQKTSALGTLGHINRIFRSIPQAGACGGVYTHVGASKRKRLFPGTAEQAGGKKKSKPETN